MTREAMLAPFADEELRTFAGRGGKTMTYVEDETVMDRLDVGYGPGNWQIAVEPIPYVEGAVKVRLGVKAKDEWVWFEDFGYPNREGGESLKEAVSDGIRRCGRFVGIARDLYRKDSPAVNSGDAPRPPQNGHQRPVAAPARSSTHVPEPVDPVWDGLLPVRPEPNGDHHGATMTTRELLSLAEGRGLTVKDVGDESKRMFGPKAWRLTDLTDEQRRAIAEELSLVPA